MKTSSLGNWPLLCWFPLGAPATAQLLMIALGRYDPRSDDSLPERLYPFYLAYAWLMLAASAAATVAILWQHYQRTLTPRRAKIATIACWTFQAILWCAWAVLCTASANATAVTWTTPTSIDATGRHNSSAKNGWRTSPAVCGITKRAAARRAFIHDASAANDQFASCPRNLA